MACGFTSLVGRLRSQIDRAELFFGNGLGDLILDATVYGGPELVLLKNGRLGGIA